MHGYPCELLQAFQSLTGGLGGRSRLLLRLQRVPGRTELQPNALGLLEMPDYLQKIPGLRVPLWTEHPHEALRRHPGHLAELFETDCAVDVVTKDRFAGAEISQKQELHAFFQKRLAIGGITRYSRLNCLFEISFQRHRAAMW